jgi:hypothetical protein
LGIGDWGLGIEKIEKKINLKNKNY